VTLSARDVAEITRLLESSAFTELDLEINGMKLSLRRGAAAAAAAGAASVPDPASAGEAAATTAAPTPGPAASSPAAGAGVHAVAAPLLGTFYRAPKPGAPPFVEVGSQVEADSVIGIIEVMKLMNAVRAGVAGRVVAILGLDGTLVEYGQTLLHIAPVAPA
jgi:acetyl-CoA carboxylase biotin carboxyl carrier protein